jgi:hypothetical protein
MEVHLMRIELKETDKNTFSFSVDGEEIGDLYKTIDEFGKDNWTAVDSLDGLSVTGETKLKAVENLCIQKSLNEYAEDLSQDLFG